MGSCLRSFILLSVLLFLALCLSCGRADRSEAPSQKNSAPVISSATILPEKPTKESDLNVMVQSNDPDGDSITYHCQWIKNETEVPGENKNILGSGNFRKGDLIQVRVTPSDGKTEGVSFLSPSVRILNSLPVIETISVEPKVPYANDSLRVTVTGGDRDGDFIFYTYRWEKNGEPLPEERREVLERGRFKKGDTVRVTVIPDDREAYGIPKKSDVVTISNSPPIIVSAPPNSVKGNTYAYQVSASDPDEDPIIFILKSGPKGMGIDKKTGLLRWTIRREDKGNHPVEIEASDKDGAKSLQRYVLAVDIK